MSLDERQISLELLPAHVWIFEESFHLAYAANHHCYLSGLEAVPEIFEE